jgi:NADH:ubiquinone oxidoreductase subunit 3 (subunit A)
MEPKDTAIIVLVIIVIVLFFSLIVASMVADNRKKTDKQGFYVYTSGASQRDMSRFSGTNQAGSPGRIADMNM